MLFLSTYIIVKKLRSLLRRQSVQLPMNLYSNIKQLFGIPGSKQNYSDIQPNKPKWILLRLIDKLSDSLTIPELPPIVQAMHC